jgi:hypothetical protein
MTCPDTLDIVAAFDRMTRRWDHLWRWPFQRQRWVWITPLLLYKVVQREQAKLHTGIEAIIGLGYLTLVARKPYRALNVLVVVLPFGLLGLSLIYRMHVPGQIVRGLGFWKEGMVAGLTLAAIIRAREHPVRFDLLDRLAICYVALGLLYLVGQPFLVGSAVGAHLSFYARELGWRSDVLYIGLFVVCRHLGVTIEQIEATLRRVLKVAVIMAVVGVYEFFRPYSFNHFVTVTLQLGRYQANVLHSPLLDPSNILAFANGTHRVRIGSLLVNNLNDGWYYVLGLGIAMELIVRGRSRPWLYASLPILGAALLFTQSRAAIVAGGVTTVFALRAQIGRIVQHRVRIAVMVALLGAAALPVVLSAGLGHRFVSSSSSVSNTGHVNGVREGLRIMGQYPLGRGLATGAGGGQNAVTKGLSSESSIFIPEDQWLQIGTQLGLLGLALYIAVLVLIISRLVPRSHDPTTAGAAIAAGGMRNALLGILVGGLFLQTFTEPVVSWTVFALCGIAVGAMDEIGAAEKLGPYISRPASPQPEMASIRV